MRTPMPPDKALEHYRTGYLKMKTVLHDRATGLPAFPLLFDRLRTLLDDRREIGVIHVEVANLQMVESLYGWQVFDRIVARVAAWFRERSGTDLPADALLAVNGVAGGQFVIFVPDHPDGGVPDAEYLERVGQALCSGLERVFDAQEFAGLSPGLCFRFGQALLSENPFFRFERCVYAAIEQARASEQRLERGRELSWTERARKIVRNRAVSIVFQPVVELQSRNVVGHEALARGPRGTIFEAPRTLFELSGRGGVALELDHLCCEKALDASTGLARRSRLFVNVLHDSLDDDDWRTERLPDLVRASGLDPADLVLEVTERSAEADPAPFISRLERFKRQGFRLALDDVGTGRPGMNAIERVKPDYLKLDTSLVRDIDASPVQQEVLATLSALARRIGSAVVAEGVETEAEAATLIDGGARFGQGHLFALPASAGSTALASGCLDGPRGS